MQLSPLVYWVAAAVALSPTIAHSIELVASSPWSHYVIIAPLLLANCLRPGTAFRAVVPRVGVGAAVLALAMGLQLLGIGADSWAIAQIGLPLAATGVALMLGRPPVLPMVLCFWVVPAPYFLFTITTPWAESMLAHGAGSVATMLGADVTVSGPLVRSGDTRLELESFQGGIVTAIVLAELGWYSSLRGERPSWIGGLRRSLLFSLTVLAVQPAAAIVAVLVFCRWGPDLAELWMTYGVWLLTAAICTTSIEYQRSRKHGFGQ